MHRLVRDKLSRDPSLPASVAQQLLHVSDSEAWSVARRYGLSVSTLCNYCLSPLDTSHSSNLCPDPSLPPEYPELIAENITPIYETDSTLCISTPNPFLSKIDALCTTYAKDIRTIVLTDDVSDDIQLEKLLETAIQHQASDIHFFCTSTSLSIQFRQLGALTPFIQLPKTSPLIQKIKLMSHMDISCQTLPQDGHFSSELNHVDVRVSSLPTLHGEDLVLRLLPKSSQLKPLSHLGFDTKINHTLKSLLSLQSGLILVTGPTGSGKTTTLYALLSELQQRKELSIVTIEDPIEIPLPGIRQSQINPKIGYDFPNALKAILRQDPDVIMIGEIRDQETAKTALDAAYTGHLVFATLHTDTIEGTLHRLSSFGCDSFLISECVKGILTQRLERIKCTCINGCATCHFSGIASRKPKGALKTKEESLWF